jgi:HEAT repeat protein
VKDPEGVELSIAALGASSAEVQRTAAMALAEYGSPLADRAKPALLNALKSVGVAAKAQVTWALVELGERSVASEALALLRQGQLDQVQTLDSGMAFDPDTLGRIVGPAELARLARDPSDAVRQFVASALSGRAEPTFTDVLVALVQDPVPGVAHQALPGLARIGTERARTALVHALEAADPQGRAGFLKALRDGIGTRGLVMALESVAKDPELRWSQTQQIFDLIQGDLAYGGRGLDDPAGADALAGFIATRPFIHWQVRAAFGLAQVGDLRAVPQLAARLTMDTQKIYGAETEWERRLRRDDNERVVCARLLADLAALYPSQASALRQQAEDALIFWTHASPVPHANAFRALAAMGSTKDLQALRDWAKPSLALPKEHEQPPIPEEWVTAQSALRYLGRLKDTPMWPWFGQALQLRPRHMDATMDGLMSSGAAILGMTLRAVAIGAAQGMAEWGQHRGFGLLLEYIEDPKENEQSREEACAALAWVAEPQDLGTVQEKILHYDEPDGAHRFVRSCLLETLIVRPRTGDLSPLMELIRTEVDADVRHRAARAIGKAGLTPELERRMFELLGQEGVANDAALALLLGAHPFAAARAVAAYAGKDPSALAELGELWEQSFGYLSDEDLDRGRLFRWVDNATAVSHVQIGQALQRWALERLSQQLQEVRFDNGPHSLTRVVLRVRLLRMARGTDAIAREHAIAALRVLGEQGALLALSDEPGEIGQRAARAYRALMAAGVSGNVQ